MPTNAKINVIDAVPIRSGAAHSIARCSGFTHKSPAAVSSSSGSSLATVITSTSRAPMATPRTLTHASVANTTPRPSALRMGDVERWRDQGDRGGEGACHRRGRQQTGQPHEKPGQESDERTERHFDVGVDSAGQRHPAPRHRERRDDESHRQAAREIGERRGRTEVARDQRGKDEDASADGRVDDACGQPAHAYRAHEPLFGAEFGRHARSLTATVDPVKRIPHGADAW